MEKEQSLKEEDQKQIISVLDQLFMALCFMSFVTWKTDVLLIKPFFLMIQLLFLYCFLIFVVILVIHLKTWISYRNCFLNIFLLYVYILLTFVDVIVIGGLYIILKMFLLNF